MTDLILICETCRKPIDGDTGSLYVRLAEVTARQKADAEWHEGYPPGTAVSIVTLLTMPDDIHWRPAHDACRSDRDESCYEIDAPRIATWPELAHWTAHLMEKKWFELSDWDQLLREAAGDARPRRIRVVAREAA